MKRIVFVAVMFSVMVTAAQAQDFTGVLNNAQYKIRVPASWNGELLVYAHGYGYIERWNPATQFDYSYADAAPGGAAMEDFLLSQGYALAGTTFSGRGWQVKEGTTELASLLGLFNGLVARPKRTVLIGYSMGSVIGLKSAEDVPLYDGVILGCSVSAGTPRGMDLAGAFALAYHTFFGWPEAWGSWYDVNDNLKFQRDVAPVLAAQLMDPANIGKFEFMRVFIDIPAEGYYQNPGWLFLGMFMATEVRAELETRAKGAIAQNADHRYVLSDADRVYLTAIGFPSFLIDQALGAMNAQTTVTAAPPQRRYVQRYFEPSGRFVRPLITLHEIGDGLIPVYMETVLRDTVAAAGNEAMLVQAFTNGAWHCGFTAPQLLSAVRAMDFWLDSGMKPGPAFFPESLGFLPAYTPPAWPIEAK